jgi:hypothetical protein
MPNVTIKLGARVRLIRKPFSKPDVRPTKEAINTGDKSNTGDKRSLDTLFKKLAVNTAESAN